MTPEGAISAPDVTSPAVTGGSTPADSSPAPSATGLPSSADVITQPVQESQPEPDPLAGIPSLEELQTLVSQKVPHAEALANIRSAYETLKPQLEEIQERFKPFEPFADKFSTPEDVQQVVDLRDKLFGFANDPQTGELVPSTAPFVEVLQQDMLRADDVTVELLNRPTFDPDTGRTVPRIELVLQGLAEDPERRAKALEILGGVEPSAQAPTWAATAEELEVVKPELQNIYRNLPYDERENLKLNDPDFINRYLEKEKFQSEMMERTKQLEAQQQQEVQQREQQVEQQAQEAGNQFVENQFREVFSGFAEALQEKTQFIKPLDPASPEAQGLPPEQLAAKNQEIQQVNKGIGLFTAVLTGALAHPDTSWMVADFLKTIGVDDKTLNGFNAARQEFALNGRNYGYLSHKYNGQNRQDVSMLKTNADQAGRRLRAHGNAVSGPILSLLSKYFELRAGSYNQTLNGAAQSRPAISGSAYDPTTAATQRQVDPGKIWDRTEIERMAYR